MLEWYLAHVRLVESSPLGKQRSRDLNDNPILACAMGAGARLVTAYDLDARVGASRSGWKSSGQLNLSTDSHGKRDHSDA